MSKLNSFSLVVFLMLASPVLGQSANSDIRYYLEQSEVQKAKAYFESLDIKKNAAAMVSLSTDVKIPNELKHYIWAGAYHAYVNDMKVDRAQVAFLLGEAGAEVSKETEQGLKMKAYMLEHFYVNGRSK